MSGDYAHLADWVRRKHTTDDVAASSCLSIRVGQPSSRNMSFFFQAEDGIRDVAVTGVQTCALPISHASRNQRARHHGTESFHGKRAVDWQPKVSRCIFRTRVSCRVGQCFFQFAKSGRSEEHTSELQSRLHLVCRLLLEKKKNNIVVC